MSTTTSTTLKNAGVNIAALLASYLLAKVADKTTTFVDTRTAITTVALQTAQTIIADKLAPTTTTTTDTTTTVTQ